MRISRDRPSGTRIPRLNDDGSNVPLLVIPDSGILAPHPSKSSPYSAGYWFSAASSGPQRPCGQFLRAWPY
jgi:hypothetical protein